VPPDHRQNKLTPHIRVLGDVEIDVDGTSSRVDAPQKRALLVRLALDAGHVVSADQLIEAAWRDELPADARKGLQTLVRRVRADVEPGRTEGVEWRVIVTVPGGYRLDPDACRIDAIEFEQAARAGIAAVDARRWHEATELLDAAQELWSEPVGAEHAGRHWAVSRVAALSELRLVASEQQRLAARHPRSRDRVDASVPTGDAACAVDPVAVVAPAGAISIDALLRLAERSGIDEVDLLDHVERLVASGAVRRLRRDGAVVIAPIPHDSRAGDR
jgi:DNA-binding SARP family transcriptional activator